MMTNPPSSERVGQEPVTATDPSTGSGQARDDGRIGFEADRAWRLAHWSVLPAYIGRWQDLGDDDRARYRCIAQAVRDAVLYDLHDHPRDPLPRSGQAAVRARRIVLTLTDEDGDGIICCSDSVSPGYGAGPSLMEAVTDWATDFANRYHDLVHFRNQGTLGPGLLSELARYEAVEAALATQPPLDAVGGEDQP